MKPSDRQPAIRFSYAHLFLLAILSGLLLAGSIPVRGLPVLLFVALVHLLIIEDYMHLHREKFRRGSYFLLVITVFLIYNTAGSWWLKNASMFGAVMAVLVNSLMMSLVFQLFHGSRRHFRGGNLGYGVLVAYWMGFEYFHHNWDLTYPWFSLGHGFSSWPSWVQWYEYTGMPGGSLWILIANIIFFSVIRHLLLRDRNRPYFLRRIILIVCWIGLPALFSAYLYHRWEPEGERISVVLVQPNNDPYNDQYTIGPLTAVGNFLNLAKPLIDEETDFVVGPESMIQENIWERHFDQSPSIDSLKAFVNDHPWITIIAGASSFNMIYTNEPVTISARSIDPDFLKGFANAYKVPYDSLSGYYDAYNLGMAIDHTGVTGKTHKSKLVAGVERMPFKKYLSSIAGDFALDLGGTVGTLGADEERFVFTHPKTQSKYGVAICYESVFGEFFADFVKNGAQYMFIITNDGWWGNTPGHRQHNAFASLRAIETRRDIARSANTGITCFINQRGDILQDTEYWVEDAIKGTVHLSNRITFFVQHGDYIGRISLFMTILLLLIRVSYTILPLHLRKSR